MYSEDQYFMCNKNIKGGQAGLIDGLKKQWVGQQSMKITNFTQYINPNSNCTANM